MRRTLVVLAATGAVTATLASASPAQVPGPSVSRPDSTSPLLIKAVAAQRSHSRAWRDVPGIVGSGVGLTPGGQPVIDVFTTRPGVDVPGTVGGVRVRTVVTGMIVARSATLRYPRPVPIGVSTGLADFATGTLGARVSNGGTVFALSNNHVFAGVNMATIGDPILQPGPAEDGGTDPADRIATLADYQEIDFDPGNANTMDAAIALTTTADVGTATLPDGYGSPSSTTVPASVGQPVQKYGRTTGFTTGSINAVNVDVDVCYFPVTETLCFPGFEAHFVNQFSVPDGSVPFSASGDSGSLVVTSGSNNPVGLLFAGGDGLTIANPIGPVLQRFNVTIDGTPAGPGPPGAPTGLNAIAGDGQIALSWTAPSFDGGSSITGYKVYRSTSPGTEVLLPTGPITGTSYPDTSAANGTTYYYKVLASNALGNGPLSNEVSATPEAAVPPASPLTIVDSFNRPNENPLTDGARWTNSVIPGESGHNVTSNQLACSVVTTCTAWRNAAQYGPDVEVSVRVPTLPGDGNVIRLYARLQMPGNTGYLLRANQINGTDQIWLERFNGAATTLLAIPQEMSPGDTIMLRVKGTTLEAWRNNGSTWSRLGFVHDSTYSAAGYVGVGLRGTTGRLDDFAARSLSAASPPGAPTGLNAIAGDGQIALSWTAPSFDGGSSITGYKVYRSTSPGTEVLLPTGPITGTSYPDTSAANGTTYYYKVLASNALGNGPLSNEVSATPEAAVPPASPLTIVDSFNRPNENPLTDGARWTNSVIPGESGHNVTSNQLACSVVTTCTAWRNAAQYGPDVEVSVRVPTLPGDGNVIRLYARLQMPGNTGYLLRANQINGTDQIWLERFNGAATTLLAIPQEMSPGDTIMLRVKGTTLEAWRNNGSTWSRLGFVHDSTYSAAGYVGVGLRGTTGRLDDFAARTIGGAPATVPDPPTGLTATPGNGQVSLSWSAPSNNGGASISGYKVFRGTSAGGEGTTPVGTPAGTTFTDTSLTNGTIYYYIVKAVNSVGDSNASAEASATPVAPATVPDPPTGLTATPGNGQVSLSWSAPSNNGGASISGYKVFRGTSAGGEGTTPVGTPAGTTFTDTSLTNGTIYYYTVKAVNSVGDSNASAEASATPVAPATVPDPPTGLTATPGNGQVSLSWSAPSNNGGASISGYKVFRGTSAGGEGTTPVGTPAGTTFTDTSLTNGTIYYYTVKAVNSVGDSNASAEASATPVAPATVPDPPTGLTATPGNGQVSLSWSAPSNNGGASISGYKVFRGTSAGGEGTTPVGTPAGTTFTDTSLTNGTIYYYTVKAVNSVGDSNASAEASATPQLAPKPLYFSLVNNGSVGGLSVANEDVVAYNGTTFSLAFDGSDVGLGSRRIDAFSWFNPTTLLFSLDTDGATLPGVAGTIDDSDVIRFDATSLGPTTSGALSMYFDGSDVGLTTSGEDVDAFEILSSGNLILSTDGSASVPGVSAGAEDLLAFTPTGLGATTIGTYALYFDGSDIGLSNSNENIDAAAVDAAGRIYLSTTGSFAAAGVSGADEDVFVFNPTTLGATTSGTVSSTLYFDGSAFGLGGNDIGAIDLPSGA